MFDSTSTTSTAETITEADYMYFRERLSKSVDNARMAFERSDFDSVSFHINSVLLFQAYVRRYEKYEDS
jgi:hypothetical protein